MTRQVAIAALIAFALTVLALSLWQPGGDSAQAPAPPTVPVTPPQVIAPSQLKDVRAGELTGVELREVTRVHPRVIRGLVLEVPDAGAAP